MKTLYFYSKNDGIIRHASIKSMSRVISIINQQPDELFFKFLMFKTSIVNEHHLKRCQNGISEKNIRLLLDATGHKDKHASTGVELNRILLQNEDELKNLFALAKKDKFLLKYLLWIFGNYLELFYFHYGELILIVSDADDIKKPPEGFNPITYKPDDRVFYSRFDHAKTRTLCEACKIKINKGKILNLYSSTFLIAFIQLLLQGANLFGGPMVF